MTFEDVNKEYAIISVGNKMVVMQLLENGAIKELWAYEDFKKRLVKEFVSVKDKETGKTKRVPLANYWLSSSKGRQYDRLVYAMPGSVVQAEANDYNGWQGFSVKAKPGDWSRNKDHLQKVICGGDTEHYIWVFNWLAAMIKEPGKHAMTSIVLRGGQGTGKGHFANNMVGALFGPQQYLHILGANQLTAEFNEHLSGKAYIFADESTWGGDPRAAAKLKGLITEDTIPIHRKFLKMVEEASALHIIISSNNEWPIPIEHDDRRFTVFDVLETQKQNDSYFAMLRDELKKGGLAAMLHELMEYQVVDKLLRSPLVTEAKSDITAQSLRHIEHWWLEILESGVIQEEKLWPDQLPKKILHTNYLEFLERHHKSSRERRSTETEMGMFLRRFTPLTQQMTVNGKIERVVHIPPLDECRKSWVKEFNWPESYEWDKDWSKPKPPKPSQEQPETIVV